MGSIASFDLNVYAAADGAPLAALHVAGFPSGCASTPAVVSGSIYVGDGIDELGGNPDGQAYFTASFDTPISAFCIAGAEDCPDEPLCDDGNVCTYDFREAGECQSEPAPNTVSCAVPVDGGMPEPGVCSDGVCVVLSQPQEAGAENP
jgi:hypothetical protein